MDEVMLTIYDIQFTIYGLGFRWVDSRSFKVEMVLGLMFHVKGITGLNDKAVP